MVQPVKSNCFSRLRTRTETTTIRRVIGLSPTDKESKLSATRGNIKTGADQGRGDAVECQL